MKGPTASVQTFIRTDFPINASLAAAFAALSYEGTAATFRALFDGRGF